MWAQGIYVCSLDTRVPSAVPDILWLMANIVKHCLQQEALFKVSLTSMAPVKLLRIERQAHRKAPIGGC